MPRNKQRYILDVDDLLVPAFLTPTNANNLLAGLNASGTTPLAAGVGGTGVVSKSTFRDQQLLRYNAAADKILGTLLNGQDLASVQALGDLTNFYPGPSIRNGAVIYDYIGADNLITSAFTNQSVVSVTINNAGTGYSANATIAIAPPPVDNGGTQATAGITVVSGVITAVTGLTGGDGYAAAPLVSIADPGPGGTGCQLSTLAISGTGLSSLTIHAGGTGYSGTAAATVNAPTSGTTALIHPTIATGAITAFTVDTAGTNYNTTTARPTITIVDSGSDNPGTGNGAWITATATTGSLVSYDIITGGTGYSANTTIQINQPGSGTQATATVIVAGGVITKLIITNAGTGYSGYFTFILTDPGPGGTGASLTANVSTGTALLGAVPSGDGDYALAWFPQPNFDFLDGQVSAVTTYNQIGAGVIFQYYTIPAWAASLQVEIYGAGGIGGSGQSGSGSIDGGGGGGGAYVRLLINTVALNVLDGQGQLKMIIGQGFGSGFGSTSLQFTATAGPVAYNLNIGPGGNGATANPSHPAGGIGGVGYIGGVPVTVGEYDINVSVLAYGMGGPGNEGAGVDGTPDGATGANFGDGGTNGLTYSTANPSLKNSAINPLYQNNSSKNDNNKGGNGLTPGNGGGGGRNGNAGGNGGNGQIVITAFVGSGAGTTTRLMVPKTMGSVVTSGLTTSAPAVLAFSSNIQSCTLNNTSSAVGDIPKYTLDVVMNIPFALASYIVDVDLVAMTSVTAAEVAAITCTVFIVSTSRFQISFFGATGASTTTLIAVPLTAAASTVINFTAYGPQ